MHPFDVMSKQAEKLSQIKVYAETRFLFRHDQEGTKRRLTSHSMTDLDVQKNFQLILADAEGLFDLHRVDVEISQ